MGELVRRLRMPKKGNRQESRRWVCEVCGNDLEMDPESGEQHCLICDIPDEL